MASVRALKQAIQKAFKKSAVPEGNARGCPFELVALTLKFAH